MRGACAPLHRAVSCRPHPFIGSAADFAAACWKLNGSTLNYFSTGYIYIFTWVCMYVYHMCVLTCVYIYTYMIFSLAQSLHSDIVSHFLSVYRRAFSSLSAAEINISVFLTLSLSLPPSSPSFAASTAVRFPAYIILRFSTRRRWTLS